MNKTQTDKQFALIVEDFYEDEVGAYPILHKSQADVFCRKLATFIIVAMVAIFAFAFILQNPIAIPAALVVTVAIIVYRNMAKEYAKKR